MSEETDAGFQREGDRTLDTESTGEDTTAESSSEEENQGEDTQSAEGENTQTETQIPFHQDPRWKEREDDWTRRFNDQETRHQDDLKAIREEFGAARKENAGNTKIPAWFGGDQAQWDAYRADRDAELAVIEERAITRARGDIEKERTTEETKVKEATEFLHSEIAAIQADKTLNPTGEKVDAEKLFKVVYDNQLIDTQGRWNYRAGFRLLKAEKPAAAAPTNTERKKVAASTISESRAEAPTKTVTTSADFQKPGAKPW